MFHEGDLQSGIALAIQQSKTVTCFVRDNGPESAEWEDQWLQDSEILSLLQSRSVVLRIQAGSQEAGFLSAFCPVNEVPALVLIHNGRLLDLLASGISRDDFGTRLRKALSSEDNTAPERVQPTTSAPESTISPNLPSEHTAATPDPVTQPQAAVPTATTEVSPRERGTRTKAKGKQKQEDPPEPAPPESTPPTARNDWLEQQRQRKIEARRERERVMAQIEADKAERRARREQEKKTREQAAAEAESTSSPLSSQSRRGMSSKATSSNLQVHLLDGGKIRKQFPAEATLETDVRPWIDSNLETKAPYTFKQILAPQPARAISVGEELSSLRELDLLPSATLVLQPVQAYSDAYAPSSGGLLSLPYTAVTGAYGLVTDSLTGAARWLRGGLFRPEEGADGMGGHTLGQALQEEQGDQAPEHDDGRSTPRNAQRNNIRVRTLADQRDGAMDQQFYNGNSLDFEPNADESKSR